jgi:hypothetical protein
MNVYIETVTGTYKVHLYWNREENKQAMEVCLMLAMPLNWPLLIIVLLVEQTGVPGENHKPNVSNW